MQAWMEMENHMARKRMIDLLLFSGTTAVLAWGASGALANARLLPAAPLEAPQHAAPPVHIQVPSTGASIRKTRPLALEAAPLAVKTPNSAASSALGNAACAPDPLRLPNTDGFNAASQLERLRAIASGTVPPENQKLPLARQQRLQAQAAWQMGLLTLHGVCSVLNTADAALWFERAQSLGEPLAAAGLAWCEIEGCKVAANPAAASKWVELLRRADAPRALYSKIKY